MPNEALNETMNEQEVFQAQVAQAVAQGSTCLQFDQMQLKFHFPLEDSEIGGTVAKVDPAGSC